LLPSFYSKKPHHEIPHGRASLRFWVDRAVSRARWALQLQRLGLSIDRVRCALDGKYVYLTRSDLVRILYERARLSSVGVRFGMAIDALEDQGSDVRVAFTDGSYDTFALIFGADRIHSRVRELVFGTENRFKRLLGYHVAAFQLADHG
jgi:2-polyprenyl-6-methoxyphenol hydroxylase-like FAD-dependent oxidoreductase